MRPPDKFLKINFVTFKRQKQQTCLNILKSYHLSTNLRHFDGDNFAGNDNKWGNKNLAVITPFSPIAVTEQHDTTTLTGLGLGLA